MRFIIGLFLALSMGSIPAQAGQINTETLATAIRHAEGNANYGILKKIKGTNYRKACIQTIEHAKRDYPNSKDFIHDLAGRYAPGRVANDPKDLNANWERNTKFWYKKLSRQHSGK